MNQKALHTKSIWKSNLLSDLRIASEAGFGAVEMAGTKVWDFLDAGFTPEKAKAALAKNNLEMISINDIANIERTDDDSIRRALYETETLSRFGDAVGCHCIQLVPLLALEGRPWEEILEKTAENIRRIARLGAKFGVRFQLEPVAWSPICSLSKAGALIDAVNEPNFGTVVDFWHLWYGRETTPAELAKFDKNKIYHIHFCDGKHNPEGTVCDENDLRGHWAGEGDIPLADWVSAVKQTGYDSWWSYELISTRHWQEDAREVAQKTSDYLDRYVFSK